MTSVIGLLPLLLRTVAAVVVILAAVGWDRLRRRDPMHGLARRAQRYWCRALLRGCGVEVDVRGVPLQPAPLLVVANHVSWLDILVLASQWRLGFLSKRDVEQWPGVGRVATALGTLYIDRGSNHGANGARAAMAARLATGGRVVFFPEATTGHGESLLPFRPRLFQAAIDTTVSVQPVAIRYLDATGSLSGAAPLVGDVRMIDHVKQLLAHRPIRAFVVVTPAIAVGEVDGRTALARACAAQIDEALNGIGGC